ncbi:hypothetical protein [Streptomyces sp. NPDC002547]
MAGFDLRGELQIGGTWVDATGNLLQRQSLTHTRGRRDQGVRVDPSTCQPLINNTNGQFSPDNPLSPYYGQFGRNTPFRLSVAAGTPALDLTGSINALASTPDATALDIVGDIDIRIDATITNWTRYTPGTVDTTQLIGKLGLAGGTKSWFLATRGGNLYFEWSADGTNSLSASSTVPFPVPASGRTAVRVTLDVNNGASGRTVTFYTAPSGTAGPWVQLGDPIVQSGTTSIFNSSVALRVGRATDVQFTQPVGRIHSAEVRSGIGGTVVANPDFTAQTVGATSFVDGAGRTWTVASPATISNRRTRLTQELAAYPTRWHPSGAHVWVEAQTAGILRRLGRGTKPLDSTLRRRIPSFSPVAYWPFEEDQGATQAYSPIPGVAAIRPLGLTFASDNTIGGSKALPAWDENAAATGVIPPMPVGAWHVECVMRLDSMPTSLETLMEVATTGTAKLYRVSIQTNNVRVDALDDDGNTLGSINSTAPLFTGRWNRLQLYVLQVGGNVEMHIVWRGVGSNGLASQSTYAGTEGRPTSVRVLGVTGSLRLGHLAAFTVPNTAAFADADDGFAGETAGGRMQRLSTETAIPVTVCGAVTAQELVGAQQPDAVLTLLQDAADADGGILYEDRNLAALRYRDRAGMYNQDAVLVLDYTQPGLGTPLEPTGDDDATLNDVTVSRTGGSSARVVLEEGPLSVQDPPNGVGVYDTTVDLNLFTDEQTDNQAGWRLHLGTYEGRRYPQVRVMMHKASDALIEQALSIDVGDKLVIRNPPPWLAPGDIELIVQGYEETFASEFEWDIVFNCTPGAPWTVAIREDAGLGRRDTAGSELAAGVSSTAAAMDVLTTLGPLWTSAAADFPFDLTVGGEVVTATAPGNLINANAFFDVDRTGWNATNGTLLRDTTVIPPYPNAKASGQVTPTGGTFAVLAGANTAAGSVNGGARCQASALVYSPAGWNSLQVQVNWFTNTGVYINTSGGALVNVPAGQWTQLAEVFTAPSNADRGQVLVRQNGTPTSGDVWYAWAVQIGRLSASAVQDEFGRTLTDTWGNADTGQAWTNSGGAAADYDTLSGYGRHINPAVSTGHHSVIAASGADFDLYCDITTAALSTGASQFAGVLARYTDLNNLLEARVEFTTANAIILSMRKRVAAVETQLGTNTTAFTHVAGTYMRVRFQGAGSLFRLKIWPAGTAEPSDWELELTDTSITVAGSVGVKSVRNASNTNTNADLRFDNFEQVNPQTFSVSRSVNGIVKNQSAGTAVSLAQPAVRAL